MNSPRQTRISSGKVHGMEGWGIGKVALLSHSDTKINK